MTRGVLRIDLPRGVLAYTQTGIPIPREQLEIDFTDTDHPLNSLNTTGINLFLTLDANFAKDANNLADMRLDVIYYCPTSGLNCAYNYDLALPTPQQQLSPVYLLPAIELWVADRDDPIKRWPSAKQHDSPIPVYSGHRNGDMVSWTVKVAENWSDVMFTWTAEGPATVIGPTGLGKSEWRISDGDAETSKDWLDWPPGKYRVICSIAFLDGSSVALETHQEVGARTTDVVVIGWIDPLHVPLDSSGLPSDITDFYPPSGTFSSPVQQGLTLLHLGLISAGRAVRPGPAVFMTSTEKEYVLNWMFKNSSNISPPPDFSDEPSLNAFRGNSIKFKLFNRFQIKYLINAIGTQFKGTPIILQQGTSIGSTKEPIMGRIHPGTSGNEEGKQQMHDNKVYHQSNDSSPDDLAVNAFNTLMAPLKWNHIGSTVSLGIDFALRYKVLNQVYPTYFIYERMEDGSFELMEIQTQAPNPSDNFNSTP